MKGRVLMLAAAAAFAVPGAGIAQSPASIAPPPMQLADAGHAHGTPFGKAGDPKKVTRSIELRMTERRRQTLWAIVPGGCLYQPGSR